MKHRAVPNHPCHKEWKAATNDYGKAILKAKRQHWIDFLEEAADHELWTANGYLKEPAGDGGKTHIPTLKVSAEDGITREVNTNEEKAALFSKAFFPDKPAQSLVPPSLQYPTPMSDPPVISRTQLRQQIDRLSPFKASSPDGIPNIVLQKTIDLIEDYLLQIYQAVIRLGVYVDIWKNFTTIVIRKQGKSSYEVPKAYRPIALLNTIVRATADDLVEI